MQINKSKNVEQKKHVHTFSIYESTGVAAPLHHECFAPSFSGELQHKLFNIEDETIIEEVEKVEACCMSIAHKTITEINWELW